MARIACTTKSVTKMLRKSAFGANSGVKESEAILLDAILSEMPLLVITESKIG